MVWGWECFFVKFAIEFESGSGYLALEIFESGVDFDF